jgi:serine/threonine protein kinase
MVKNWSYASPQLLNGEAFGLQTDIWSLGVVLYEGMHGVTPLVALTKARLIEKMKTWKIEYSTLVQITAEMQDFINSCCKMKEEERATLESLRNHVALADAMPKKAETIEPERKDRSTLNKEIMKKFRLEFLKKYPAMQVGWVPTGPKAKSFEKSGSVDDLPDREVKEEEKAWKMQPLGWAPLSRGEFDYVWEGISDHDGSLGMLGMRYRPPLRLEDYHHPPYHYLSSFTFS